ncbi:helix-turn-helix transcriptional regulator [Kitasatospora sp. NA04385]|uniref:helix-turn-helix transcriptional regulator n=1 Tax=Kitasatospora sp. NA04385 TaxID=2742135 RepID=UPI0020CB5E5C|nr:helix-turn-helix transcriptional regulator [Kitasatospora sp. NA04385]
MIESTVSMHRRRSDGPAPVSRTDAGAVGDTMEQLIAGARRSVSLALVADGKFAAEARRILAARPQRVPGSPAPVLRVLCVGAATRDAVELLTNPYLPQTEVRVTETDLREVMVVDGRGALVRSAAGHADGAAVAVHDTAVVRALDLLFAGAWSRARPLARHLDFRPRLDHDQARRVLEMLSDGRTDESAAQQLGVSLRTYRRHVAEIMRELGANSRFQAGFRAVELGLMPRSA